MWAVAVLGLKCSEPSHIGRESALRVPWGVVLGLVTWDPREQRLPGGQSRSVMWESTRSHHGAGGREAGRLGLRPEGPAACLVPQRCSVCRVVLVPRCPRPHGAVLPSLGPGPLCAPDHAPPVRSDRGCPACPPAPAPWGLTSRVLLSPLSSPRAGVPFHSCVHFSVQALVCAADPSRVLLSS